MWPGSTEDEIQIIYLDNATDERPIMDLSNAKDQRDKICVLVLSRVKEAKYVCW